MQHEMIFQLLECLGNPNVVGAYSAEKALNILMTQTFDVIITDYNMPGQNGVSFAEQIRKSDSKVLIYLRTSFEETRFNASEMQYFTGYLPKSASTVFLRKEFNRVFTGTQCEKSVE